MTFKEQPSVRVTVPNRRVGEERMPPIAYLRLDVLSDLGKGGLNLDDTERKLLGQKPKEQLIRRLVALKHQHQIELDAAKQDLALANEKLRKTEETVAGIEIRLDQIINEKTDLKNRMFDCVKLELKEVTSRLERFMTAEEEWDKTMEYGNKTFLIHSKVKLFIKRILRVPIDDFLSFWATKDPGLHTIRIYRFGKFLINIPESIEMHDKWQKTVMSIPSIDNSECSLFLNGIIKDLMAGDDRKQNLRAIQDMIEKANSEVSEILREMEDNGKNLKMTRETQISTSRDANEMLTKHGKGLAKKDLLNDKKRYNEFNETVDKSRKQYQAILRQILENHKCISTISKRFFECSERLDALKAQEKEELGALEGARQLRSEAKAEINRVEALVRTAEDNLAVSTAEYEQRKKEILQKKRRMPKPVESPDSQKNSEYDKLVQECVNAFIAKVRTQFPEIELTYSPMSVKFEKTLRNIALLFIEKDGFMTTRDVTDRFPTTAHTQYLSWCGSEYDIARIGLGGNNLFRFLVECNKPRNPVIFFFGTKNSSERLINNRNLTSAQEKIASNGQNPFELLIPAIKAKETHK